MSEVKSLFIPEGLEGERVDAAIARLLGFSRTRAAELAAEGAVSVDGKRVAKSERVSAGAWLEVAMPERTGPREATPRVEPVPGMNIVHDDTEIVVVDKPAGVAAHPSVGWSGPTVVGGLAAAAARGRKGGRPAVATPERLARARQLIASGLTVREAIREKGTPYAELRLSDPALSDDRLIDAMIEHPILINRPLVVSPLGVKLCRPSEAVLDLLPSGQLAAFAKEDGEQVVDAQGNRTRSA